MQNSVLYRVLQALGGLLLIAVAVNSDWADAMANWEYGQTVSIWAGRVMWSVGLLLVILPGTTVLFPKGTGWLGLNGYCVVIWVVWGACLYTSNQCTTSTYIHGQSLAQGSQSSKHDAHLAALAKIEAAKKRLADNTGSGNATTNGVQVSGAESDLTAAQRTEDAACKGRRAAASDECAKVRGSTLTARQTLAAARTALARAQERDSARVDLATAEAEEMASPDSIVEQPKEGVTQSVAQIQLLLTLLSKLGMVLIAYAARTPAVKAQKAKRRETGEGPTLGGTPLPMGVISIASRKERDKVRRWLGNAAVLESGAEIQLGTLRKEYRRTGADLSADDLRTILQAILPAGNVIPRNSGYVVTGRRLETADERRERRRAAI